MGVEMFIAFGYFRITVSSMTDREDMRYQRRSLRCCCSGSSREIFLGPSADLRSHFSCRSDATLRFSFCLSAVAAIRIARKSIKSIRLKKAKRLTQGPQRQRVSSSAESCQTSIFFRTYTGTFKRRLIRSTEQSPLKWGGKAAMIESIRVHLPIHTQNGTMLHLGGEVEVDRTPLIERETSLLPRDSRTE